MTGHATPEELELVQELEQRLARSTTEADDLVDLGLLYVEPCHREQDAIDVLETALEREPEHGWVRLWLAYIYLHYVMDEVALARADELLGPLLEAADELAAAARMLRAEIEDQRESPAAERVHLLEEAVERAPGWVYNRQSLAWAYSEAGRHDDALDQIDAARRNIATDDPSARVATRRFEELITGRLGHRAEERLLADRERIERELAGEGDVA